MMSAVESPPATMILPSASSWTAFSQAFVDASQAWDASCKFVPSAPSEAVDMLKAEHDEIVATLKADHEKEMSELRKYFENVCQELEMKYRAETEETIPARTTGVATPGCWTISGPMSLDLATNNAPVSLELGSSHVEFEFESMSPR